MFFYPQQPTPYPPQYIQKIQTPETQVTCWFVNSPKELETIRLTDLFTLQIGINKTTNEIYTRQLLTDGTIQNSVYKLCVDNTDEVKSVSDRLAELENKMKELTNGNTGSNITASVEDTSGDAAVQSNDGRKKHRTTNADANELRSVERS